MKSDRGRVASRNGKVKDTFRAKRNAGHFRSEVGQEMDLQQIRYSQVWEDHLLLEKGLEIIPEDDILSVASAGCNVLALLLHEPKSITAIDMSPAQIALVQLKLEGIRELSHPEFACLIGVRDGYDRWQLYQKIRKALPTDCRKFWDQRRIEIETGVIHCGRFEKYIRIPMAKFLPRVWSSDLVERLLTSSSLEVQAKIFEEEADIPEFAEMFRWYSDREMLARHGRDPAQFKYVGEMDVGKYFLNRLRYAFTHIPMRGNFYMEFFLTSRYRDLEQGPPYLQPTFFNRLKGLIDRVTVVHGELERYLYSVPKHMFSKANLSDIFEYTSEEQTEKLLTVMAQRFRPHGRLAYWNLLVSRSRPESLKDQLIPLSEKAESLSRRDRVWFYNAFRIEEIIGEKVKRGVSS